MVKKIKINLKKTEILRKFISSTSMIKKNFKNLLKFSLKKGKKKKLTSQFLNVFWKEKKNSNFNKIFGLHRLFISMHLTLNVRDINLRKRILKKMVFPTERFKSRMKAKWIFQLQKRKNFAVSHSFAKTILINLINYKKLTRNWTLNKKEIYLSGLQFFKTTRKKKYLYLLRKRKNRVNYLKKMKKKALEKKVH